MLRNKGLVKGICACCGDMQIFELCEFYDENADNNKLTFAEYLDYKSANMGFCSKCGYINDNITKLIGKHTIDVVNSKEYKKIQDDYFIEEYKDLYGAYYRKFDCGDYESFAMLYEADDKVDFLYIKILAAIFEIKSSIRAEYFEDRCDMENEKDEARYDALISSLTRQMEYSNKKAIVALKELQPESRYSNILVAEILSRDGRVDLAREIINNYNERYQIDEELQEFFKEITSEIETI